MTARAGRVFLAAFAVTALWALIMGLALTCAGIVLPEGAGAAILGVIFCLAVLAIALAQSAGSKP